MSSTEQIGAQRWGGSGRKNGITVVSLVLGWISIVLVLVVIAFPLGGLLGLIATVTGIIGLRRVSRGTAETRKYALTGLVLGIVALAGAIYLGVKIGGLVSSHTTDFRHFWTCVTNAPGKHQQNLCAKQLANQLGR